ncbi:translation initiation factor eIF-2B subunit alpha [Orbilia brochopaga]|uniref:Translation initiation factor eIF2B subunit alpha n=1 Tax=Orbilia brochopaga TaxID=3140254 RepID=A0AAV9U6M5_9PEZI
MSSPVLEVPPKLFIPDKVEITPTTAAPLPDSQPGVVRVTKGEFDIRGAYLNYLRNDPELTMPVAAIKSLVDLVDKIEAQTTSEFLDLLNKGIIALKDSIRNPISLSAGCDLFLRFIVRYLRHSQTLPRLVNHLKQSYKLFDLRAKDSRNKIAKLGSSFISDGSTVMTISFSRVVLAMMMDATKKHIRFKVVVTEGAGGKKLASVLRARGIPVAVIPEGAVGYAMELVDMVLIGAEGVVENGGIINGLSHPTSRRRWTRLTGVAVLGTFQMATLARAAGKDVFAVCETHKFVRLYPINGFDMPVKQSVINFSTDDTPVKSPTDEDTIEKSERIGNDRFVDFTPPTLLTAIITEAGVLTPSSVSEELLKIWF